MVRALLFITIIGLSGAFSPSKSVAADSVAEKTWQLVAIDGEDFGAKATLTFPEPNKISGEGPCNFYGASVTGPYPVFVPGPIMSTQRACPFLAEEQQFLDALSAMTIADIQDDTVILSTPDGREMVFKPFD